MLDKYIEERFEPYFIFGYSKDGKLVNVTSATGGDFLLTPEAADTLIKERQAILEQLKKLAHALDDTNPELFSTLWYGASSPQPEPEQPK